MSNISGINKVRRLLVWVFLSGIFCPSAAPAQKLVKDYTGSHSVAISAIEPDSTNYVDIDPIGKSVGDTRVVMLGEQDHGDAPTFLAKTRLIKYLHEKKGFNILAFESDFFGLNYGWDQLKKQKPRIDTFLRGNVFGIWTACDACNYLFYKYIPESYQTAVPLKITGFDSQQYLDYSFYNLKDRLDSVLRHVNILITKQINYVSEILPLIDSSKKWNFIPPKNIARINSCLRYLQIIQTQLSGVSNPNSFWLLVVDNLIQQVEGVKNKFNTGKYDSNGRDIQMAKNLKWLIENKFKGEKIIVWAANEHIAMSLKNLTGSDYRNRETMGENLSKILPKEESVYTLGFTSYQGIAGRNGVKQYKVYIPRKNSFEVWLNDLGYRFAFVDFKEYNRLYPDAKDVFFMSALGHFNTDGKWNKIYDGMFYIRDMYRCKN